MVFKKLAIAATAFVLVVSGSFATSASAAPVPEAVYTASVPPKPTKNDKPYVATAKDKSAKKGNQNAEFTTFACPCYNYVVAKQQLGAGIIGDGLGANLEIEAQFLKSTDYHGLSQLALQKTGGQAIEFGTTVDPALFGNSQPHIFAGYRKNGVWAGYGVGFVDYAPNTSYTYGTQLPTGTAKRFLIQYSAGNFWLAYDGAWIGYIPGTVFTAAPSVTFISGDLFQVFMEESGSTVQSCSDLGNGLPASDVNAGRLGSISIYGTVPTTATVVTASVIPSTAIGYTVTALSARTVRGGGPGADSTLTTVGTTGNC
jgi:hypothetical protein